MSTSSEYRQGVIERALRESSWVLPRTPTHDEFTGAAQSVASSRYTEADGTAEIVRAIGVWAEEASRLIEEPHRRYRSLPGPFVVHGVIRRLKDAQEGSTAVSEQSEADALVAIHPLLPKVHTAWGQWIKIRGGHERLSTSPPEVWEAFRVNRRLWWRWMPKRSADVARRLHLGEPIEGYVAGMGKGRDFAEVDAEVNS